MPEDSERPRGRGRPAVDEATAEAESRDNGAATEVATAGPAADPAEFERLRSRLIIKYRGRR